LFYACFNLPLLLLLRERWVVTLGYNQRLKENSKVAPISCLEASCPSSKSQYYGSRELAIYC